MVYNTYHKYIGSVLANFNKPMVKMNKLVEEGAQSVRVKFARQFTGLVGLGSCRLHR